MEGCDRAFVQRSDLKKHEVVHLGPARAKPFRCLAEGCTEAFAGKGNLTQHARIHDTTTWYKCPHEGCTKSFARKSQLRAHSQAEKG